MSVESEEEESEGSNEEEFAREDMQIELKVVKKKDEGVRKEGQSALKSVVRGEMVVVEEEPLKERANGVKRSHEEMAHEGLVDLMEYKSAEALEKLGLDRLKEELGARGMMVGGDLKQRAHRLFQVRGLVREQYPPEVLAKTKKPKS